jgi:hypothetical protein
MGDYLRLFIFPFIQSIWKHLVANLDYFCECDHSKHTSMVLESFFWQQCDAICNQNAIVPLIKHHHCVKKELNHNNVKVEISLCNIYNWNGERQLNTKYVSLHVKLWSTLFSLVPNVASITTILCCPCIIIVSFCIVFGFPQWRAYCVLSMNLLFQGQIFNSKTHTMDFVGHAYARFLRPFLCSWYVSWANFPSRNWTSC